jgi:hypothetical protein
MNNEFTRMQKLAGLIAESFDDFDNDDEIDFDLDQAYKESSSEHPYNDVLNIFESYEDDDILDEFKSTFPEGKPISKEDYNDFAMSFINDMSESMFIKANWIDITDPDIFEKAGLV